MYAAIEEASVGEGSDTYAQIAPEPRRRDVTPSPANAAPAPSGSAIDHSARWLPILFSRSSKLVYLD